MTGCLPGGYTPTVTTTPSFRITTGAGFAAMKSATTISRVSPRGGQKGIWYSTSRPDDTSLIIAESAIDAISYHALHRPDHARYFSIAGEMNPMQHEFLASAMRKLPEGGGVIIATDRGRRRRKPCRPYPGDCHQHRPRRSWCHRTPPRWAREGLEQCLA